eukprot:CAMPEP_0117736312 /NCGR_PEP_ID=MMETSP0947-20121206/1850_1 /TAXON_ID=44440 /ORGANISM="Chattonella subsalsa, Strain CCMP2191" /LENGTH=485 /DNA_ID=CAMNT_0005551569 /DNA_START=54 /DNA_END=1511 /DNA_ORIENTATION=+
MGKLDQERRQRLLLEARRDRLAWVNEAASCQVGKGGARRSQEELSLFDRNSAISRLLPSAKEFLALLSELEGQNSVSQQSVAASDTVEESSMELGSMESDVAYQQFLDRLKSPSSADLVVSMKQFVKSFSAQGKESGLEASEFLRRAAKLQKQLENQLKMHDAWKEEAETERWLTTRKSLERFLFHKLYHAGWSLVEDPVADKNLTSRLKQLRFLTFEHVDLPAPTVTQSDSEVEGAEGLDKDPSSLWQQAEQELLRVNEMTWPEGKVARLVHSAELVIKYLQANRPSPPPARTLGENGEVVEERPVSTPAPGADEFLPALILLVKTAQPTQLHSDIAYIQAYSDPQSLISRAGYVVTHFASAAHFLENVDAASLSITPEEFDQQIRRCQLLAEQEMEAQMPATLHLSSHSSLSEHYQFTDPSVVANVSLEKEEEYKNSYSQGLYQEMSISQVRFLRQQNAHQCSNGCHYSGISQKSAMELSRLI